VSVFDLIVRSMG